MLRLRARSIIAVLRKSFPNPGTALTFETPFQLMVGTILSAQCTDVRVNLVTPGLFRKYPSVQAFATANKTELERDIQSTGFYRNKARNIIGNAKALLEFHHGSVPKTMAELVALPGVGRKTANCVLGAAFSINEGVVVDTHVMRLSGRLGLSSQRTPEKIEQDLMRIVPPKDWFALSNLLILHGRGVCKARKPDCPSCSLKKLCPSATRMMKQYWN